MSSVDGIGRDRYLAAEGGQCPADPSTSYLIFKEHIRHLDYTHSPTAQAVGFMRHHMNPLRGKKVQQINNLHIHEDGDAEPGRQFIVYAPPRLATAGRRSFLEEFATLEAAIAWCQRTTDYLHGRGGSRR